MSLNITETILPISACPSEAKECFAVAYRYQDGFHALISTPVATFEEALEFRPVVHTECQMDRLKLIRMTHFSDNHEELATWGGEENGWVV